MAAKTRLGYEGYGVRRAGSFGAKFGHTHPVGKITRLGLDGYGVRRNGSFAGKGSGGGPATGERKLPIVLPNGIGRMTAQLGGVILSKSRRTDLGSS